MIGTFTSKNAEEITPAFLTETYLHGIDLNDFNGVPYPEPAIQFHVNRALGRAQETLGIPLKKQIVKAEPVDDGLVKGVHYDRVIKRLPYRATEAGQFYKVMLPDAQIIFVDRLRIFFLNQLTLTFAQEDVRLEWTKEGILHVVPRILSGFWGQWGLLNSKIIFQDYMRGQQFIPDFWAIDYTCGFDGPLPDRVVEWVCLEAAIQILGIVGTARTPGLASQTISFDGYSHSETLTQSASSHLYSALEKVYRDELATIDLKQIKGTYRGLKVYSA